MSTPRVTPPGAPQGAGAGSRPAAGGAPAAPAATAAPRPTPPTSGRPETPAPRGDQARRRGRGQRRPPRLASLQLKRIDPWTVLKISLIVAIVMFFVWMIAVAVLYLSLGSLDVWTKLNETWKTLTTADAQGTPTELITPGAVFGVTAVIGAINIVLFTALATIAAFVYNAAAGMSGGVELTLGERD